MSLALLDIVNAVEDLLEDIMYIYSETCLNRTLNRFMMFNATFHNISVISWQENKLESCINQTLNKLESYINQTPNKQESCTNKT